MEKAGLARLAVARWFSLIVFVSKGKIRLRFGVDYHRLKADTVRDTHPILRINKYIDFLEEAKLPSTLDVNSECWQAEMDEKDVDKTAFVPI